jgi:protein-S-isoprenylcysteine O-methyltransferase Ste14
MGSVGWAPLLFVAVVSAAVVLTRAVPLDWPGINDLPAHLVGLSFGALGIVLAATAGRARASVLSSGEDCGFAREIIDAGPYRRWRNPIYLSQALLLLTMAEVTKSIWFVGAALAFAVLMTKLQVIPEEQEFEQRFGDKYLAYKMRTRRWI